MAPMDTSSRVENIDFVLNVLHEDVKRLHARLDGYEKNLADVMLAAKGNPMLAALLRTNGIKV